MSGSAQVDRYPNHHPRCRIREGNDHGGPTCNCRELRREPLLSRPAVGASARQHWLGAIDDIAQGDPARRDRVRELVVDQATLAHRAGLQDALALVRKHLAAGDCIDTAEAALEQKLDHAEPWQRARRDAYDATGPTEEQMRPAVQHAIASAVALGEGWIRLQVVDHDEAGDRFDWHVSSPPTRSVVITEGLPPITYLADPPPEGLIARLIERIRDTEKRR